ncbi:SH3 domain-containing protein 19-like [Oscarella lobularis]|uniref:SH3 domain-containing protein 19-like n=1 Tax=Oscarella lobularis TaxID=121494 RepID=UPI003313378B
MSDDQNGSDAEDLPPIPPRPDEPKKPGRPTARPARPPPGAKPSVPTTRPTIISSRPKADDEPKKPPPIPPSRPISSASPPTMKKPPVPSMRPPAKETKDDDEENPDDEGEKQENTKQAPPPKPRAPPSRPGPPPRPAPSKEKREEEHEPSKAERPSKPPPHSKAKPDVPEMRPRKGTAPRPSPPRKRPEKANASENSAPDQTEEEVESGAGTGGKSPPQKPRPAPPKRTQASSISGKEDKPKPKPPAHRPLPKSRPTEPEGDGEEGSESAELAPRPKPKPKPSPTPAKDHSDDEDSKDSGKSTVAKPVPPKRAPRPTRAAVEEDDTEDVFEEKERGSPPEKKRPPPPSKPGPPKKPPPAAARPPPPKKKISHQGDEVREKETSATKPKPRPPPPAVIKREGPGRPGRPGGAPPPKRPPLKVENSTDEGQSRPKASTRRLSAKAVELDPPPPLPPRPGPSHILFRYTCKDPHGIANVDYFPENDDELSFSKGDIIVFLSRIDDNWLMGRNNTAEGMFPKKFVSVVKGLPGQGNPTFPSAVGIYDFETESSDELPFIAGDIIRLLDRVDDAWFRGSIGSAEGIFPADFVEILVDLPSSTSKTVTYAAQEQQSSNQQMTERLSGPRCRAKFDFSAESDNELNFSAGMEIKLIDRVSGDWLKGSIGDKVGIFPASFVDVLVALPEKIDDGKAEGNGPWAVAEFDFTGENDAELSFQAGDSITVLRRIDADWLGGNLRGKEGRFPVAYVKLDASAQLIADGEEMVRLSRHYRASTSDPTAGPHCIGTFDFDGQEGELSFKVGDVIVLTERVNDEWLVGRLNNQEGMFPVAFVDVVMDLS